MPTDKSKERKRIIVEEVGAEPPVKDVEQTSGAADTATADAKVTVETAAPTAEALDEVIEKVEELKDITETIAEEVDKSVEVQEELAEAAEKVAPSAANENAEMGPPQPIGQSKLPSILVVLIPGLLILGAILGGIYFYQKSTSDVTSQETPTPVAEGTAEPTATATPAATKVDLTKYPIAVQNGVGTAGIAGAAKDTLVAAGFKVSTTGNADNYEYTDTIIKVKSTVPAEFVTKLTTALSAKYKVAKAETLAASSKDDVVVIIGSSKP